MYAGAATTRPLSVYIDQSAFSAQSPQSNRINMIKPAGNAASRLLPFLRLTLFSAAAVIIFIIRSRQSKE